MVSTIANDGIYTPPRIVAGELPPNAGPKQVVFHPAQQHRVISAETAVTMKKMMEGVVEFGTARRAALDGYSVAGKTGTAQKVDPKTGTYSKTKYIASFVGFSPVNEPALTIAVILDSAEGLASGWTGLRAGVAAHHAAGAGVQARSARSRDQEDVQAADRWWLRRRATSMKAQTTWARR